jgi:hypothetical protein
VGCCLACVPSRGFGVGCLRRRVTAADSSSRGIRCPFRVLVRLRTGCIGFPKPTSPLDLSSAVWSFRRRRSRGSFDTIPDSPLVGFRVPPESYPADPSPIRCVSAGSGSSHGLCVPSALAGIEGPRSAGLPCPLRSAFRVWLPSWRFPPLETSPALFRADSTPGIRHTLRSVPLPGGTGDHYSHRWTRLPLPDRCTVGRTLRPDRSTSTSGL